MLPTGTKLEEENALELFRNVRLHCSAKAFEIGLEAGLGFHSEASWVRGRYVMLSLSLDSSIGKRPRQVGIGWQKVNHQSIGN